MYSNILRIVIVDDDAMSSKLIEKLVKQALPKLKMEAINFQDPRLALEHIRESDVHIVITDVEMPHINGQEMLKEVKSMSKGIKVAIITASNSLLISLSCFMDGADGYLLKPYKVDHIRELISHFHQNLVWWREIFDSAHHNKTAANKAAGK